MVKLKEIELQEVGIEEIVSFSKLKDSPIITILDDLTATQFNYVVAYADLLKLVYVMVKGTKRVAFLGNVYVALKIAKTIQVKAQVIYYHTSIKEIGLKSNLKRKQDTERYIVKAYDQTGNKAEPFIDTNIPSVECKILSKINYQDLKYAVVARHSKNGKVDPRQVKELRKEYLQSKCL